MTDLETRPPSANRTAGDAGTLGSRFLIFPQPPFVPGYERPERVWISAINGPIGAGPSDGLIRVVAPSGVKTPYEFPDLPPYRGARLDDARPDADGHFDHLSPGDPGFEAAHVFACVRHTLDAISGYRAPGRWFFADTADVLEAVTRVRGWPNAQAGYGFLELGEVEGDDGEVHPFALNFDVIAHEVGHLLLYNAAPQDTRRAWHPDARAFHEAVGDVTAMVALLHFDLVLDHLLRRTGGDLLAANELDRIAETAPERQIRRAGTGLRMADVGDEPHDRALPLVGAIFDAILAIYEALLDEEAGVAPVPAPTRRRRRLGARPPAPSRQEPTPRPVHAVQKRALTRARDIVGRAFFSSWEAIGARPPSLVHAGRSIARAGPWRTRPDLARLIAGSLSRRGLLPPGSL